MGIKFQKFERTNIVIFRGLITNVQVKFVHLGAYHLQFHFFNPVGTYISYGNQKVIK
jgi:hypothetical protein